jgi:hypothetical protein
MCQWRPRMGKTTWTEDRTEQATQWWVGGTSALEISHRLGVTRNSVIGKMHRTVGRLEPEETKKRIGGGASKRRDFVPSRINIRPRHTCVIEFDEPDPASIPASWLLDARGPLALDFDQAFRDDRLTPDCCRRITGDVQQPGWFYCGDIVSEGSPYCPRHDSASRLPKTGMVRR